MKEPSRWLGLETSYKLKRQSLRRQIAESVEALAILVYVIYPPRGQKKRSSLFFPSPDSRVFCSRRSFSPPKSLLRNRDWQFIWPDQSRTTFSSSNLSLSLFSFGKSVVCAESIIDSFGKPIDKSPDMIDITPDDLSSQNVACDFSLINSVRGALSYHNVQQMLHTQRFPSRSQGQLFIIIHRAHWFPSCRHLWAASRPAAPCVSTRIIRQTAS